MCHNLKASAVPNCTLKSDQRDKETTRKTCHNLSAIKITTGIFLERSDEYYNTAMRMLTEAKELLWPKERMNECDDDVNIMSDSKHNDSMLLLLVLYRCVLCVGG